MIEVNIFSGHTYITDETRKIRNDGTVFVRQGDMWFGPNGQVIQQEGPIARNLNTGSPSTAGDPFGEHNALDV